jgi:hypothetical protein
MNDEVIEKPLFVDAKDFGYQIEMYMRENNCIGYIDAIIKYCTIHSLDVESVASSVTETLKEKIQMEAADYGVMIKGVSKPIHSFG